ncbi:MAG TPA: baseplate J/gp47 family protein [Verrucomicrobiae bacterium]|nr:baseplate J/gp47 family protein [Verrucomicrobiae bacterium]
MKDVIYIDIEDDITSIIGKVKSAKAKIVALVPPKRIGVLQSVVNLKLLQRAAQADDKRLVLITSEQSLASLAAGVKIPVAKNLQSKPELAPITALEIDDEEVINGEELPVGELDAAAKPAPTTGIESPKAAAAFESLQKTPSTKSGAPTPKMSANKNASRIPNFDKFRKWLFLGIGGGLLLILFLVWAIFFAPHATVAITAKTTLVNIDLPLSLDTDTPTDPEKNAIQPLAEELRKTQTVDFQATGSKEVGEKASGSMTLTNASNSDPIVIEAGTEFTSGNGLVFKSNADVTVPGARIENGTIIGGQANVGVTAAAIGSEYNLAAQNYTSSNQSVSASGGSMTGGSKRTVKIISQNDVNQAREKIKDQNNNDAKNEIKARFGDDVVVLEDSFVTTVGEPSVSPAVGQEATAGKLTVETTYTLLAVAKKDVKALLENFLQKELEGKTDQRIYENGEKTVRFSRFQQEAGNLSVRLTAAGHIGPEVKENELKQQLQGKRLGEIQQLVETIPGVENVDVRFSPFWVTAAPGADKITIEFVIKNNEQ